jgi:hypothetical protein
MILRAAVKGISMKTANILLLCDEASRHTGTVDDHIMAFKKFSQHCIVIVDSRAAAELNIDLSLFDAVIFHYSIVIASSTYLPQALFEQLAKFQGPKILFIQDEYRWVNRTASAARALGISVVFTVVNSDVVRAIYRDPWFDTVRFEQTLTGFVPKNLVARSVPAYEQRPIDVSYRARRVPSWLGAFGQEKWVIGERFLCDSHRYDLRCDIVMTEGSRIYGEQWIDFLSNSKAVLGTESGASFIDFSGEVLQHVEDYERKNPAASFEDVQRRFLDGDGEVLIHVISPRCFEAAALRTLMILYPGTYSGVLEPHRHYVVLERDHSNMDTVVEILKDPVRAQTIIKAAYDEVALSPDWTFEAFVVRFDKVASEEMQKFDLSAKDQPTLRRKTLEEINRQTLFSELELNSRQAAQSRIKSMAWALRLQRVSRTVSVSIHKALPPSIARRVVQGGARASSIVKPALRRLLFGRTD